MGEAVFLFGTGNFPHVTRNAFIDMTIRQILSTLP
jgi:hypothetical protein